MNHTIIAVNVKYSKKRNKQQWPTLIPKKKIVSSAKNLRKTKTSSRVEMQNDVQSIHHM